MFGKAEYFKRGKNYVNNQLFPHHKQLSTLMLYTTDLCDSACKHCLIWAKRPPQYLSLETIKKIMSSRCISRSTSVGLEGGEFLLHPEAEEILQWFASNHPNFDLFSNCLKPDRVIEAVKKHKPEKLYISLDGTEETYLYMRGKDGYNSVLKVIEQLKKEVPIFVMFTLSPYNDFSDLEHVAELCKTHGVFLRVGIYNNIPFFDTLDESKVAAFGQLKNKELLNFKRLKAIQSGKVLHQNMSGLETETPPASWQVPAVVKEFSENYDFIVLYKNWTEGRLRLKCYSILDSIVVLPDGSVPICQNLDLKLGNVFENSLDHIFNSEESSKKQKHYSENCNQCWISFHRKYDIALYRNYEKFFGKWATSKLLGFYKWEEDQSKSYKAAVR